MKSLPLLFLAAVLLAAPSGLVSCSTAPLLASRNADPAYLDQKAKDRYAVYVRLGQAEESALAAGRQEDAAGYRTARQKAYQEYLEADGAAARAREEEKRREAGAAASPRP